MVKVGADLNSKIRAELRTGPKTLSVLARSIGASQSGVHYQLRKMLDSGVLRKAAENKYYLADMKQIEKDTLKALVDKELEVSRISELTLSRIHGEGKIKKALENLKERGLVESAGDKYKIAPEGAKELGICYFCNKEISDGHAILSSIGGWGDYHFGVIVHTKCISNWFRGYLGDEVGWGIDDSVVCDFCGLPLSLEILRQYLFQERLYVSKNEIRKHLLKKEKAVLEQVEKASYLLEIRDYEDVEEFVDKIVENSEKHKIVMEKYDPPERKRELWKIAQELLKIEEGCQKLFNTDDYYFFRLVKNAVEKLFDPISIIYAAEEPNWASSVKWYSGGDHCLVMVKNGEKYHPYCYGLQKQLVLHEESKEK